MQYDKRIRNATGINILKECLREKEKEATKTKNIQERWEYLMRNGYSQTGQSSKRTECKRGKNTKWKGQGSATTNPIQQNKKGKI